MRETGFTPTQPRRNEGSVTRPFVIRRRSILSSGVDIALEGGNQYKYTGQSILPKVTITCDGTTLAAGTDYTITKGEGTVIPLIMEKTMM